VEGLLDEVGWQADGDTGDPPLPRHHHRLERLLPPRLMCGPERLAGVLRPLHRDTEGSKHRQHGCGGSPAATPGSVSIARLHSVLAGQLAKVAVPVRGRQSGVSNSCRIPWMGSFTQSGRLLISYRSSYSAFSSSMNSSSTSTWRRDRGRKSPSTATSR